MTSTLPVIALFALLAVLVSASSAQPAERTDIIPPLDRIQRDRPRLLLRPIPTATAISLDQLRKAPRGPDYEVLLSQLRVQDNAAAQAMVWLLTGEKAAADAAIARMADYRAPEEYDTFHVHARLTEFGLAYDWLYAYPGFTDAVKADIRKQVLPVAWKGTRNADDHVFHNYVWMSAGGSALWALATAGEDAESDSLFEAVRTRFNTGLFPAMRYLDGLPSEPLGYWFYYDFSPCMMTLLATASAFDVDLASHIRETQSDWVSRHFMTVIHGVLPDLRFIPWGDMQSGPNGGTTLEYAGVMDAATWLLGSPQGVWMGRRLAEKRGTNRFHRSTALFYMIYTRNLTQDSREPDLSYLSGNRQAGHFVARSSWDDDATLVTFRATDHYGDHNHHDQGSFMVYREGFLAVDPPVYHKVRGPQEPTAVHNTLLLDGLGQRDCRGQSFRTLEIFEEKRTSGPMLETGDILFYIDKGEWAAVAGQFSQAYDTTRVASCVRQLLFIRPGTLLCIDHLHAPPGRTLPGVDWLLQLPGPPSLTPDGVAVANEKSQLLFKPLGLDLSRTPPTIQTTEVQTYTVSLPYNYPGSGATGEILLVHQIEVAPLTEASFRPATVGWRQETDHVDVTHNDKTYRFGLDAPWDVRLLDD